VAFRHMSCFSVAFFWRGLSLTPHPETAGPNFRGVLCWTPSRGCAGGGSVQGLGGAADGRWRILLAPDPPNGTRRAGAATGTSEGSADRQSAIARSAAVMCSTVPKVNDPAADRKFQSPSRFKIPLFLKEPVKI
jgi:hypothetical protein